MKKLRLTLLLIFLTAPTGALAALPNPDRNPKQVHSQTSFDDIGDPVSAIFKWLIIFLPTVTALYLIISGYRYIVAQGNQELVDKAKKSLLYSIYGFVIACISVALIVAVSRALGFNVGL